MISKIISKEELYKIVEDKINKFDFESVHDFMQIAKWTWGNWPHEDSVPDVIKMEDSVRNLCKIVIEDNSFKVYSGGFLVIRKKNDIVFSFDFFQLQCGRNI